MAGAPSCVFICGCFELIKVTIALDDRSDNFMGNAERLEFQLLEAMTFAKKTKRDSICMRSETAGKALGSTLGPG